MGDELRKMKELARKTSTCNAIEADLQRDRETIERIFSDNRDCEVPPSRYDWLYLGNPFGRARAWLVQDVSNGLFFGASAAIPRKIWVNGKIAMGYVLADFSIDKNYRSLGPAIKLNKATLSAIDEEEARLAWDFPSEGMAKVHQWMKYGPFGNLVRFVRPINSHGVLEAKLGKRWGLKSLCGCIDAACRLARPRLNRGYGFEIVRASSTVFDESFAEIDLRVGPVFSVCGARSPEYLGWRYGENPLQDFYVLSLKHEGRLAGFSVYAVDERRAMRIYDLFADGEPKTKKNLLAATISAAEESKVDSMEVSLLEGSPWNECLKRCLFFPRESGRRVFVFANRKRPLGSMADSPEKWHMTDGDRDV